MAFWKKKKEDLSNIKEAVNRKENEYEMPPRKELPQEPQPLSENRPMMPPPPIGKDFIRTPSVHKLEGQDDEAHMFVKVERYDTILDKLETLKETIRRNTEILNTMLDVDKMKVDISQHLKDSLDDMGASLASLDGEFLRPEDAGEYMKKADPQLEKIKRDLDELKGRVSQL